MQRSLAFFKSQMSESFYRKVSLLEKIIGNRHWLTTGTFKERVIISYLREVLPKSLSVSSGFVAFPAAKPFTGQKPEKYDHLNSSSYELSRQLDVIVYDSHTHPTIYEDSDIAIVMPEAVRGIIDVKGVLDHAHLSDATVALIDFGLKWKSYSAFRKGFCLDSELIEPGLYQYFWDTKLDDNNNPKIGIKGHRDKLAKMVAASFSREDVDVVPMIKQSSVYGKYEVSAAHDWSDPEKPAYSYISHRGQYVVFDENGNPNLAGDRTLASIVRDILCTNKMLTNRLLIDPDETAYDDVLPLEDRGATVVFKFDPPKPNP